MECSSKILFWTSTREFICLLVGETSQGRGSDWADIVYNVARWLRLGGWGNECLNGLKRWQKVMLTFKDLNGLGFTIFYS